MTTVNFHSVLHCRKGILLQPYPQQHPQTPLPSCPINRPILLTSTSGQEHCEELTGIIHATFLIKLIYYSYHISFGPNIILLLDCNSVVGFAFYKLMQLSRRKNNVTVGHYQKSGVKSLHDGTREHHQLGNSDEDTVSLRNDMPGGQVQLNVIFDLSVFCIS